MVSPPRHARSRLRSAVVGALLIGGAADARADYKESYKKGMEAVDKGNWADVARHMRQAATEQAKEGEKLKLYGMRFEDYVPNYFLGQALFKAGDCEGALVAWAASEGQGAIRKTDYFKELTKNKGVCQQRVAQKQPTEKPPTAPAGPDPAAVAQATRAAEQTLSAADAEARAVADLQGDPALAGRWAQDPSLGGAQKLALDLLASAHGRLESARRKPDLVQLAEAKDWASRASAQLASLKQTASQRREDARRAVASTEPLKTTPVSPAGPTTTAPVSTAPAGPSAELVGAARAYFAGQYREALGALGSTSPASGRSGAQAMLFRAASRYALFVLGGERDDALKNEARADVQACRRLDASFEPLPQYFSPRFTAFFKSVN
jgi:hypothetical protein